MNSPENIRNLNRSKYEPCIVSVVLVVRNEEANIDKCLRQIISQDYPKDLMEIIIADGMSTDKTREIASSFAIYGIPLRIITNPDGQRSHGLNLAIRAAKGDVLARIDARTVIGIDYLSRCVHTLLATGADNVGGVQKVQEPITPTLTQEAIGLAMSHPFGIGNAQFRLGMKSGYVDTVYLGCFRREVFDKVGFFDEEASVISEDSDINQRIRDAGGKVYLNSDIIAGYYARETILELWKLYFRYGGARAGYVLKHWRFTSWRQVVPPLFILSLLLLGGLSFLSRNSLFTLAVVIGFYLIADVAVSIKLSLKRRKPCLFAKLLLTFPCMHFSYAIGFWKCLLVPDSPRTYWGN